MAFNHKIADFWLPNFGFKRSLLSLLVYDQNVFFGGRGGRRGEEAVDEEGVAVKDA